jgi:hypothetical protein
MNDIIGQAYIESFFISFHLKCWIRTIDNQFPEFNNEVQHSGMGDCRTRRCGVWPEGTIICRQRNGIRWLS